ncbi:hypothetical protein LSH36_368g05102 [Paralvinella palmiformis]|uniref:Uncharacterized protein n=1 Tax=Paralvinella palmiformis TaxID=53620 RepID=A0AAD9N186_9ANNE|nr:hypothetical protein LSH36_368g05102 [Paralvinella palmiformis]
MLFSADATPVSCLYNQQSGLRIILTLNGRAAIWSHLPSYLLDTVMNHCGPGQTPLKICPSYCIVCYTPIQGPLAEHACHHTNHSSTISFQHFQKRSEVWQHDRHTQCFTPCIDHGYLPFHKVLLN